MHPAQELPGHEAFQALHAEGELAQGEVTLGFHVALAQAVEVAGPAILQPALLGLHGQTFTI